MNFDKIDKTLITLKVDEREVLFIVLAEDGSINRKGDGRPDCRDNDLYIGISKEGLFSKLRPYLTEDMNEFLQRTYDVPNKKGRLCDLKILFAGDEFETGTQFLYGELSQGPPKPFVDFCIKAVELTENWFQAQKKISFSSKVDNDSRLAKKSWWKF